LVGDTCQDEHTTFAMDGGDSVAVAAARFTALAASDQSKNNERIEKGERKRKR
jgi:hypothetical protein